MIQPFKKIEGLYSNKYIAIFSSDSNKKTIEDRDRYNVIVEFDPWDKLISFKCDCPGFRYSNGKVLCRHISNQQEDSLGILQILKLWNEIPEIPKIEVEEK